MTRAAATLAAGQLHVLGRLVDASNLALLAELETDDAPIRCIYKPVAGERPLWDFPGAPLAAREVLTAQVAGCFGWDLVPETVWRDEGPAGPGMCQRWIEATPDTPVRLLAAEDVPPGWSEIAEGTDAAGEVIVLAHEGGPSMQRLVVLDALVNNADRKGGHVLRRPDGHLAGIDHGVTFHAENKLRTVLWGWAGQPVPEAIMAELRAGAEAFGTLVRGAGDPVIPGPHPLADDEIESALGRLDHLLVSATFPMPGTEWPSLPWPPM